MECTRYTTGFGLARMREGDSGGGGIGDIGDGTDCSLGNMVTMAAVGVVKFIVKVSGIFSFDVEAVPDGIYTY